MLGLDHWRSCRGRQPLRRQRLSSSTSTPPPTNTPLHATRPESLTRHRNPKSLTHRQSPAFAGLVAASFEVMRSQAHALELHLPVNMRSPLALPPSCLSGPK